MIDAPLILGTFTLGAPAETPAPLAMVEPTPCDRHGHSWQRDPAELGSGEISTKDRHFTCGRHGCPATMVEEWHPDIARWMQRVVREIV